MNLTSIFNITLNDLGVYYKNYKNGRVDIIIYSPIAHCKYKTKKVKQFKSLNDAKEFINEFKQDIDKEYNVNSAIYIYNFLNKYA